MDPEGVQIAAPKPDGRAGAERGADSNIYPQASPSDSTGRPRNLHVSPFLQGASLSCLQGLNKNKILVEINISNTSRFVLLMDICKLPGGYKLNRAGHLYGSGPTIGEVTRWVSTELTAHELVSRTQPLCIGLITFPEAAGGSKDGLEILRQAENERQRGRVRIRGKR